MDLAGDGSVRAKYMYYPGTDQVGSVRALFNSAAQVLNQYAYRPFGEMESVNEQVVNPLRFTAREYDTSTELYYYRNRWYDPRLGRFISEDPIGVAGGINAYAYAQNDPINYTDPMGLICQRWTETESVRRYANGAWGPWRKERERSFLVGDCFKEIQDVRDDKGGNVREEELPGWVCAGTIVGTVAVANDRRNKARRLDRARQRYREARSRAQYLNELWSADVRYGRPATESYRAYEAAQAAVTQAAEVMQDAREDLTTANGVMAGGMILSAAACLNPFTP